VHQCFVICWFVRSYTVSLSQHYGRDVREQSRPALETAGSKTEEAIRDWRKSRNEKIHDLCFSLNIIRMTKSMWSWEEHVNTWGRQQMHTGFWSGNLKETDRLEHTRVDEKIILKLILKDQIGRVRTGFIWLRIRTSNGFYFPKMQGMSWLLENQLTSEGVNYSWWSLFSWQSSDRYIPIGVPSRIGLPELQEHCTASKDPVMLGL
jgi:hypothetical protein